MGRAVMLKNKALEKCKVALSQRRIVLGEDGSSSRAYSVPAVRIP
jgi:hypothetical protein